MNWELGAMSQKSGIGSEDEESTNSKTQTGQDTRRVGSGGWSNGI